jgi:hypothetical protein
MSQGTEARFAHLLEPIRDLAKNWEIDIAKEVTPASLRARLPRRHARAPRPAA